MPKTTTPTPAAQKMRLKYVTDEQFASMTVNELCELTGRTATAIRHAAAARGIKPIRSRRAPAKMINVYLAAHLIDAATAAAAAAGMSRSAYLTHLLTQAMTSAAGGAEAAEADRLAEKAADFTTLEGGNRPTPPEDGTK